MRAAAALLALIVTLSGCLDAEAPAAEAVAPTTRPADEAPAAPPPEPAPALAPPPEPLNATVAPTPPDPCAEPVLGLHHPCVADGFHFGEAAYWDGGAVPDALRSAPPDRCAQTTGCRDVTFVVAETAPGSRLRVDAQIFFRDPSHVRTMADTVDGGVETALTLSLYAPGLEPGVDAPTQRDSTAGVFAESLLVGGVDEETREVLDGPALGTWTLRVHGWLPDGVSYRLRAKLDAPAPPSDEVAYPDLRVIPPFEVGFMAPTSSFMPGAPTPTALPLAGCMAEEYLEAERNGLERPTLCLRFSMGFANGGDGNFRLKMLGAAEAPSLVEESGDIPVVQSVCTADGRACRDLPGAPGLVARWDEAHGHFHYQNAYVFDLHRVRPVEGGAPALEFVSSSGKLGIDPGPESLVGWWESFAQRAPWAPAGTDETGAADPADKELNAGWGDVYDWNRAGNYVPFPADATGRPVPGEYVLRGATDPDGEIVETDEGNNLGYTWFRVDAFGGVEILERGEGRDPWDAAKLVFDVTP